MGRVATAPRWRVADGALPYIGTWEPNFPGVLPFHILSVALFGNSEIGFRVIEVVFNLSALLVLYHLLIRWLLARAAFFSCFFYAQAYLHGGILNFGQRDGFAAGLLVFALAILMRDALRRRLVWAGLLFGWITLIRPLYGILPMTFIALYWSELRWRERVAFAAAIVVPAVVSFIPYLSGHGLRAYLAATVLFLTQLYPYVGSPKMAEFPRMLRYFSVPVLLAAIQILSYNLWREHFPTAFRWRTKSERSLFVLFGCESILIILLQHRYLPYHFAILLLLVSPIAAVFVERVLAATGWPLIRMALAAGILVVATFLRTPFPSILQSAVSFDWTRGLYAGGFIPSEDRERRAMDDAVISYLSEPQNARGACEVCSYDARLRARLDRDEASRFTEFQALTLADGRGGHPAFQQAWREEFLVRLRDQPARFVILNGYMNF